MACTRILYATGAVLVGALVGLVAILASPHCGGGGDGASSAAIPTVPNITEVLPPELRLWALLSPSYLFRYERGTFWSPEVRRPRASYVYIPDAGRTIFAAETGSRRGGGERYRHGRESASDEVYLVKDDGVKDRGYNPPRTMSAHVKSESTVASPLRPPEHGDPAFLLVDNRTACFLAYSERLGSQTRLVCSDGRSSRMGEPVDGSSPPVLFDGKVWVKLAGERRSSGDRHRIAAVDPHTMEGDFRGSFYSALGGDDYLTEEVLSWGREEVFVPGCRRPQLGVGLLVGGLSIFGISLLAWKRLPMPFAIYLGLSTAFYGMVTLSIEHDTDSWYVSITGWLIASYRDLWYMSCWLIASGSAMLSAWYCHRTLRRQAHLRGQATHAIFHFLPVGAVSYFLGFFLLCVDFAPFAFLALSAAPLLGLGVVSRHPLPTVLSGLGGVIIASGFDAYSFYASYVASWGLILVASWWGLHFHAPGVMAKCSPSVRSVLLSAGGVFYFCTALLSIGRQEHILPFSLLTTVPLLGIGLWTGHALPLALVIVSLVLSFVAFVQFLLGRLDELFTSMTDVVWGLVGVLMVCAALATAGMALCGARSAVRNRLELSSRFRAQVMKAGKWGRQGALRSVELEPFFVEEGDDHIL